MTDDLVKELDTEIERVRKIVISSEGIDPEDFNIRGELYRMSAQIAPNAREQDIFYMNKLISPKIGEISIDIAAGTGFLTKNVATWTKSKVYAIDPSDVQLRNLERKCEGLSVKTILGSLSEMSTLENIGDDMGKIDFVTSFGGIHHIVDIEGKNSQKMMFEHVSKVLKKGGRFVAADVSANTPLSNWFESIVKKYCLTGHEEKWLSPERLQGELIANTDLRYVKSEIIPLQWIFETKNHMAMFIKALNALDLTNEEIVEKLATVLGFEERANKVYLNWPMIFFHLEKAK